MKPTFKHAALAILISLGVTGCLSHNNSNPADAAPKPIQPNKPETQPEQVKPEENKPTVEDTTEQPLVPEDVAIPEKDSPLVRGSASYKGDLIAVVTTYPENGVINKTEPFNDGTVHLEARFSGIATGPDYEDDFVYLKVNSKTVGAIEVETLQVDKVTKNFEDKFGSEDYYGGYKGGFNKV